MRIDYLREFVRLAQTLSFTQTAAEFYITQPTLSKHVQLMERELGAPLLIRSTHGTELTEEGRIAYKHFSSILMEYDGMVGEIKALDEGIAGSITIGYFGYGGMAFMEEGLDRFYASYPNIELSVLAHQPHQIIDALLNGQIDVGLIFSTERLSQGEFTFKRIGEIPWGIVISEESPLATKDEITFADLQGRSMIRASTEEEFYQLQLTFLGVNGFTPSNIITCSQADIIPSILLSTDSYFVGENAFGRKRIVERPLAGCAQGIPIGLCYRRSNPNPYIPHFLNCF